MGISRETASRVNYRWRGICSTCSYEKAIQGNVECSFIADLLVLVQKKLKNMNAPSVMISATRNDARVPTAGFKEPIGSHHLQRSLKSQT